jgi:uncharacterized protein (TIGR02145 family)
MKHIFTISLCFLALSLSVCGQDFVPSGFISIGSSDSTDFFVSEISLTWNQAKANAESLGGHLGTFATVQENNAILSELSNEAFWIGLFQPEGSEEPSGSWGWVTSEVLAFTNWSAGEPNDNGDYTENCVHADGLPYLLWNDAQCDSQSRFILELSTISGCTIEQACNFNPDANVYDGSCDFSSCKCLNGTVWSDELEGCVVANPTDSNLDGCTDLNDLMDLLGAYGICGQTEFAACGDDIEYEGYSYSTVQIGDQCWFAENCRYIPEVSPSNEGNTTDPYYYVYGYEGTDVTSAQATSSFATYGVLYNWPAVMTEGLCPSGWHIPSDGEWQTLEISLGMSESDAAIDGWRGSPVGDYMKSTTGWSNNGNGLNPIGFIALPGGSNYSGVFSSTGLYGHWWSASESGSSARRRVLNYYDDVYRDAYNRDDGFSARCVRD